MDEPPPLVTNPLTQEINMKARVIALVALALGLAVGLPATVATTGLRPAPAATMSLSVPLTGATQSWAGPGGCCP
jgi:hypothetical protein